MRGAAGWWFVFLLPVVVLGGLWLVRRDPTKPNWVIPTQMAESPAYRSQTVNPILAQGVTLQPPPEGTLAREEHPLNYANSEADRKRAGVELSNPLPPSAENLSRGRWVYETFCSVCHGPGGAGDGPIVPKFPNPPSFLSDSSKALPDGEMFHIITYGRNKMPGYAGQVPWEERWQAVLYIRWLQKGKS